ncbi:MAG: aspartyl protease family protein [Candidatus Zixiibacteriota bacterium]
MHLKKICESFLLLLIIILIQPVVGKEITDYVPMQQVALLRNINSIKTTATVDLGGLNGTMEIIFVVPDKIYNLTDLGILRLAQTYNGESAWMEDQNGQILELSGMEKKNLITSAYMAGMSYLFDDRMPGTVDFQKDTVLKETTYELFLLLPDGGDSLWMFVNPSTSRAEIIREKLDEIEVYTYMSDFREVDGIEIPFVNRTESVIPQLNSVITTTSVEFNVPVPSELFEMTAGGEKDYLFPENKDSVIVPFELYAGHIYIEVSLNGGAVKKFILDSGAGVNVLDKALSDELGLITSGDLPAKGVAGYGTASVAGVDSIDVGDIRLYNQIVGIIDLSNIRTLAKEGFGGVVGFDLLQRFPFRLDFRDNFLVFYNPDTFVPPDSEFAVDFEFHLKVPVVQAQYDKIKGRFLVDFGNALGLILHKAFVDNNNLDSTFSEVKKMERGVGGVGGQSDGFAAIGTMFKFGPAEILNPTLMVAGGSGGIMDSREIDGNIGNLVLRDFSVLMDYKNKKMYILPVQ